MSNRAGLGLQNITIVNLSDQFSKFGDLIWLLPSANPQLGRIEPLSEYKRDGLIAFADGINWNPGSGKGYYWYNASVPAWFLISAVQTVNIIFGGLSNTTSYTDIINGGTASTASYTDIIFGGNA